MFRGDSLGSMERWSRKFGATHRISFQIITNITSIEVFSFSLSIGWTIVDYFLCKIFSSIFAIVVRSPCTNSTTFFIPRWMSCKISLICSILSRSKRRDSLEVRMDDHWIGASNVGFIRIFIIKSLMRISSWGADKCCNGWRLVQIWISVEVNFGSCWRRRHSNWIVA